MDKITQTRAARRDRALYWLVEIFANFVLPYLVYTQTQAKIGQVDALLAASLPPILWSMIEFAWRRQVDAVSLLVIAGIVLSLLAFFGGGSARFLQLRENLVTGVIGLVFLGSVAAGKPLIYLLARAGMARKSAAEAKAFEQLRGDRYFEASMTIMTLVWGAGLVAQTALACALVFAMPIATYLIVSPVLGYGVMAALAVWTYFYSKRRRRIGKQMRTAAAAHETACADQS
jgi:uncharacterized membrane protein (DUF485 family)